VSFEQKAATARDKVQLTVVDYTTANSETDEDSLYSWKLLANHGFYYMISQDRILIVSVSGELS
jgi:hypothetical protein